MNNKYLHSRNYSIQQSGTSFVEFERVQISAFKMKGVEVLLFQLNCLQTQKLCVNKLSFIWVHLSSLSMKSEANGYNQVTEASLSFEIPHIWSSGLNTVEWTVLGMVNSSLHKVWFDRIASVITYNKQKSNFPKRFQPTNFPISERFVTFW